MNREFDAEVANKIAGCRFERSLNASGAVLCHLSMVNGVIVSAFAYNETEAHRAAFAKARDFENYLLHERQYERELGILGDRFAADRPYFITPDGPYHAVQDSEELA